MIYDNPINNNSFKMVIPDSKRLKSFKVSLQDVMLPSFRIPPTNVPTTPMGLNRGNLAGTTIEHSPLVCRVILGESFKTYSEIFRWMLEYSNYKTMHGSNLSSGIYPEYVNIDILDNTKENITASLKYHNAWPMEIGDLEMTYIEDGTIRVSVMVTFEFTSLTMYINGKEIFNMEKP